MRAGGRAELAVRAGRVVRDGGALSVRAVRTGAAPHPLHVPASFDTLRITACPIAAVDDDAPALLTATSGSTGEPKVVVRSHAILLAQLDAIRATVALDGIDVATMPIVLLANLAAGVTSVIPGVDVRRPGAADPERLADDIAASGATSIVASPAMLERLARIDARSRVRSLRRIVSGGAPVMPPLLDALHAVAPDAELVALYGSTEAEPIARLAFGEITGADRTAMQRGAGLLAGRIAAHTDVRIVAGEVVVRGPHVVPGYLDPRHDALTKIRCGETVWHRTGDLGRFDEKGRLWLLGRAAAVRPNDPVVVGPFQVECALAFDPRVARAALVHAGGRRVVAVEGRPGARLRSDELRRTLHWAAVDDVRIVRRIPVDRRHNAKVDYPRLERQLARSR